MLLRRGLELVDEEQAEEVEAQHQSQQHNTDAETEYWKMEKAATQEKAASLAANAVMDISRSKK